MKIVILTIGSRGDVQPYVALGAGLQRAGHRVVLATDNAFENLVANHGLEFSPLQGSFFNWLRAARANRHWLARDDWP